MLFGFVKSTNKRVGYPPGVSRGFVILFLLFSVSAAHAGTCTSRASGNWSAAGTWTGTGGCTTPNASHDVVLASGYTVTIDVANAACNNLTFNANAGAAYHGLTHSGTNALAVSGSVTMNLPTINNYWSTWNVGAGSATVAGNVTFAGAPANNTLVSRILIDSGSLAITGNLAFANIATYFQNQTIQLTGSGTFRVAGTITNSNRAQLFTGKSSVFDYNGTGAQTIATDWATGAYANLHVKPASGSPTKTIGSGTLEVREDFIVGDGANAVTVTAATNNPVVDAGGNFTVAGSATYTASNTDLTIYGNYSNAGTFTKGTGSVTLRAKSAATTLTTGSSALNHLYVGKENTLDDGLVGYWKFDETAAGSFADSSGNGRTGTGFGAAGSNNTPQPSTTVAPLGIANVRSVSLDGTDDYIRVNDADDLDLSGTEFTISLWSKWNGSSQYLWIVSKKDTAYNQVGGYLLYADNTNTVFDFLGASGAFVRNAPFTGDTNWHHYLITKNSNRIVMYIDGTEVMSNGTYNATSTTAGTDYFRIGWRIVSGVAYYAGGLIDELRVYNRKLTKSEIKALAAGLDSNGTAGTVTLQNALDVDGNLYINTTTLDTKSGSNYSINVGGDWTNTAGTFTPRTGTVTFDGTGAQSVTTNSGTFNALAVSNSAGTVTFADGFSTATLTDTAAGSDLRFQNGSTVNISGTLTLTGADGDLITLDTDDGIYQPFTFNVTGGAQSVNYVSIANTSASGNDISGTNSVNLGGTDYYEDSPRWTIAPGTREQEGFRWRDDNGTEATAGWLALQDTNITRARDLNTRLRMLVNVSSTVGSSQYQLEYKKSTDAAYVKVPVPSGSIGAVTSGAADTGSTSLDIPFPASISAGDLLVTAVACKRAVDPATPAGWTLLENAQATNAGTGDGTIDEGYGRTSVFVKEAAGTESGNLTVTIASGNAAVGRMFKYTKVAGTVWSLAAASGADNTGDVSWSVTAGSDPGVKAGDVILVASAINTDGLTFSAQAITQAGVTFGAETELQDSGTTTGQDSKLVVSDHVVASGVSSAAPVYAMTASGVDTNAPSGSSVLLRIRQLFGPITVSPSSNIGASGANTTAQLTAPAGKNSGTDFDAGRIQDDENPADAVTISSDDYSEMEWSLIASEIATDSSIYQFRVTTNGSVFDTYSVTPAWTIEGASPPAAGMDALFLSGD